MSTTWHLKYHHKTQKSTISGPMKQWDKVKARLTQLKEYHPLAKRQSFLVFQPFNFWSFRSGILRSILNTEYMFCNSGGRVWDQVNLCWFMPKMGDVFGFLSRSNQEARLNENRVTSQWKVLAVLTKSTWISKCIWNISQSTKKCWEKQQARLPNMLVVIHPKVYVLTHERNMTIFNLVSIY